MSRRVEREFKDPDIPITTDRRVWWARVLLLVIGVGIFYIIATWIGSDPSFAYNETLESPDYIQVNYDEGCFHVDYNNTAVNHTVVRISLVSRDYSYPIEVFSLESGNNFDVHIPDREWGHEYLVSVIEDHVDHTIIYHWVISKTQIGYTTVRPL